MPSAVRVASENEGGKARLTRDVDVAVNRDDLERIAEAALPFGFHFRHVASVDMLLDNAEPRASSGIHLVFAGEKVRPEYLGPGHAPDDSVGNPRARQGGVQAFSSGRIFSRRARTVAFQT